MNTLKRFTLIVSILILTACSVPFAPTATPQPTVNAELATLTQNRQKWDALKATHYRFKLNIGCYCAFRSQMPLSIEVKDGKVVSMLDQNGQPASESSDIFDKYNTVEKLFETLQAALTGEADKTTIDYNAQDGYPENVYIDYIALAADDERSFTVSDFQIIK